MAKKAFDKEIKELPKTLKWAFKEPIIDSFNKVISSISSYSLVTVGSGGSLSCANFISRIHERYTGNISCALTPMEFAFSNINPLVNAVLFLTSTGNNKDILNAFDIAVQKGFSSIGIICASVGSRLIKKAKKNPYVQVAEFHNPAGKDGFLAVNSLISTSILTLRAYKEINLPQEDLDLLINNAPNLETPEWEKVLACRTIVALSGEWGLPAMIDLESKFTEAALGNILISDLRNFGHGRHHWFDKRGDESALIVIETPSISKLAAKTINNLPDIYPRAVLKTKFDGPLGGIDLLLQIFFLVAKIGKLANIDPGMPNVPEFGRKIYSIGLLPILPIKSKTNKAIWSYRKSKASGEPIPFVEKYLEEFLLQLKQATFSGIIFDYDGTLCDPKERYTQPNEEISAYLKKILSKGIAVGIATGRGKSVQNSLRKIIEEGLRDRVIIGNYNGSKLLKLSDNLDNYSDTVSNSITKAYKILDTDELLSKKITIKKRPKQITVLPNSNVTPLKVLNKLFELLGIITDIKILVSDHSIDIIDSSVSKMAVVNEIRKILPKESKVLIIGDQGQYGGNDYEILKEPFSLSVNKVSSSLLSCWNLSPTGLIGANATYSILKSMVFSDKKFNLDIDTLMREIRQ